MKCDCIMDIEQELADHYTKELGVKASATCGNIGYTFGPEPGIVMRYDFFVKAEKPGYRSLKGKAVSMIASYCPFCGKSAKDQS